MCRNVAASSISEGRHGTETTASTASSYSKVQRQKDMSSRSSAVRPSQNISQESTVLAGELFYLLSFNTVRYLPWVAWWCDW